MSKKMVGFMIGVILFGIVMAGATFAYLVSEVNIIGGLATANKFKVDVETTGAIDGPITLGVSKEEGLSSRVKIRMNSDFDLS